MLTNEDAIRDDYLNVAEEQMLATARMWDKLLGAIFPKDEVPNEPREERQD